MKEETSNSQGIMLKSAHKGMNLMILLSRLKIGKMRMKEETGNV